MWVCETIFGYVGILIASALAFSAAGLSLDKLTIVAGALSVGIGFGLQSIVNNFVSGLILLWERPLRVGDWIAVGGEEGIVKRINVRATEIETFDKASLIVPNSEFISGRVKNWVHSNHQARIIIPISVKNSTDPKRIEAILSEVALAHREVLSQPAPRVLFMKITDSSLDFELRCIVDVDVMAITRSELLFALYARLQTEGIDMPMTTRTVEIADMDKLGSAIAASMAVVDKKEV
jgi:potassium-dependent mechanosensitive channel